MAKLVFKDATILFGGRDISGNTNDVRAESASEEVEFTNFASGGYKEFDYGLKRGEAAIQGFRDAPEPDTLLRTDRLEGVPLSLSITNPLAAGDFVWNLRTVKSKYKLGGKVGDADRFDMSLVGDRPLLPGVALDVATIIGNGNSAAINHGAVSAAQKAYGILHVLALTGTSVDLIIQSDDAGGFGSPVSRITFAQVTTAPAYQWVELAGPITDTHWRVNRTLVGTSAQFRVLFAIL